jgi:L-fucose isomerase-like protein
MRLGIVAIARPTFDVPFAQTTAERAAKTLRDAGLDIAGSSSLVMDADSLTAALETLSTESIDALVVLQASFADSSLAIQAAERQGPVVFWAFPEDRTGGRLRLNSFCGINLAGFTLTNRGRDYHWLYRAADDDTAAAEIRNMLDRHPSAPQRNGVSDVAQIPQSALRAAETVRGRLSSITIGRVGERPDGFEPCGYEAAALTAVLGVTVDEVPLPELFDRAGAASPGDVAAARDRASAFLDGTEDVDQQSLTQSLRLNVGLTSLIRDHGWAGVATRCWPETFTEFGGAACTPMSLLNEDGTPGTCEADVYGNITGLILGWLAESAAFVTDLVHLDRETNTGVLWHCGLAPFEMADPESAPHATIHSNRKKPLLSEFPLKPGRVTIARVSQSSNQHRMVIGSGDMVRAPLAFSGTAGVVHFDRPVDAVMSTVMGEGLEHHFGIVYGDVRDELRALANLLSIDTVEL